MTVIPLGYAQVNFIHGGDGLRFPGEVTLGLDIGSYSGTVATLAEDVGDQWVDHIMPELTSAIEFRTCHVKYGPQATGPSADQPYSVVGSVALAGAPSNLAWLVHKGTALGGRAGRGRMYLPGVADGAVGSDGDLDNAAVAAMQSSMNDFVSSLIVLDVVPVVLHGEESPISLPTPITSVTVDGHAATQRRRMRR